MRVLCTTRKQVFLLAYLKIPPRYAIRLWFKADGCVRPGRNICHLLQRWPIWSKAEMTNATKALETTNTPL